MLDPSVSVDVFQAPHHPQSESEELYQVGDLKRRFLSIMSQSFSTGSLNRLTEFTCRSATSNLFGISYGLNGFLNDIVWISITHILMVNHALQRNSHDDYNHDVQTFLQGVAGVVGWCEGAG